ncbi:MAG: putative trypsin-like protease [Acidimicrobiales bacterium]|nr:putative trypsin-like protease [Acidimicrobiales bacterium]
MPPVRRPLPALTAAFLAVALLVILPTAAQAEKLPPPAHTQIVGGQKATVGQFPWMAALIRRSASTREQGFTCGGTVLSRSWVLTAAHCVLDYESEYPDSKYGNYVAPSFYSVLTGTTNLSQSGGGSRLNVIGIYPHPDYDPRTSQNDYALLRLASPTTAPEIRVIGSSSSELALDDPGTQQTTVGWGITNESASSIPLDERFVQVPMQSDGICGAAYPPGRADEFGNPLTYYASSMLCAGYPGGGKDSCSGDSGGPLAIQAPDDSWRETGVVSFGYGCAEPDNYGVYSRLSHAASWISNQRRFGPFSPESSAYITQMYLDFVHRAPTSTELADWRSELRTHAASDLPVSLQNSAKWQDNGGTIARLYKAAFLRIPDTNGYTHWTNRRWAGIGPVAIAQNYATSSEFLNRYGSLSDDAYIERLYQNVFERAADPQGKAYWHGKLASGTSRGRVLYELSNSNEYRGANVAYVRTVTASFALLRTVPTSAELTDRLPLATRALIDSLRTSYRYAARFAS